MPRNTDTEVRTETISTDTVTVGTVETPAKPAFNPFLLLSADQTSALLSRLNPIWVKDNGSDAATVMLEHGCSLAEATLAQWLISTADDHIEAKLLTAATDSSRKMLVNVGAGSLTAVAFICEDYARLKPESQRKFRISLRDAVFSKFHGETAERVFSKIAEAIKVTDVKLWMRA